MKLIQNRSAVALSLVAFSLLIPLNAIAGNVRVNTRSVRAATYSNGNINVSTGRTSVSIPSRRRTWYPWRYWRTPWRSSCRQNAYQRTSQSSNSGGKVTHHSSTSSYCR